MSERAPQQERSIASTNRMLDVAEELLATKGPDALTVEAVVAGASTSTGSFYARFESRRGLLKRIHERFLERVGEEIFAFLQEPIKGENLVEDLTFFILGLMEISDRHANGFTLFVAQNSFDEEFKSDSLAVMTVVHQYFDQVLLGHSNPDRGGITEEVKDQCWRIAYGLFLQHVLYEPSFVSGKDETNFELARATARSIEKVARN